MSFFETASLVLISDFAAASASAVSGSGANTGKAYSIKPTDGSGDFTFERGSDITATRVNKDGYIEKGRGNFLLQSNQFDTTWTLGSGLSLTSGQSGYDGSSDAWVYSDTSTGNSLGQSLSTSGVQTLSIYAKAGTANGIRLRWLGGLGGNSYFNIADSSTEAYSTTNTIQTKKESIGNGWYRISIVFNSAVNTIRLYVADGSTTSSTNGSIYIQSAQLEQGLVATDYIETTTAPLRAGLLEDEPRFDYHNSASASPSPSASLLLEPSRTNSILYSEALLSYDQFKTIGSEVTLSYTTSSTPEGLNSSVTTVLETATTGNHRCFFEDIAPCTIGLTYSFSVFAKSIGGRNIRIGDGAKGFEVDTIVDLSDGSILTNANNNASVEDYGNGWYKISAFGTNNSLYSTQRLFINSVDGTTLSFAGDTTKGFLLWGAQFEEGSYPTSYIPTYGTAATRGVEKIVNTNISSIVNTSNAYTIFFDFTRPNADYPSSWQIVGIDNGGYTSRLKIIQRANFDQFRVNVYDGTTNVTSTDINNSAQNKIAVVYDGGTSYKIFTNGALLETLTCGAINGTRFISGENGTQRTIENHKQILLFPEALSDTDCEILTGATTYSSFAAMASALNYTVYE